MTRDLGGG